MNTALDEACEDARFYHTMWKNAEAREALLREALREIERAVDVAPCRWCRGVDTDAGLGHDDNCPAYVAHRALQPRERRTA